MERDELKRILKRLQDIVEDLECEIYSDKESYLVDKDYKTVVSYLQSNDDDGDY